MMKNKVKQKMIANVFKELLEEFSTIDFAEYLK